MEKSGNFIFFIEKVIQGLRVIPGFEPLLIKISVR
jgi:hypothetical protein